MSANPSAIRSNKLSFKQQQLKFRENAILDAVNKLLAQKGFDLMTMDEVAADVGIAKASLYKHFESKEALAAASMTRLLEDALSVVEGISTKLSAIDKLKALVRWGIKLHLGGTMPLLPSTRSSIQQSLLTNALYMARLSALTEKLGEWITEAQLSGNLTPSLPGEVILYTIFARSCDPVADFLKLGGAFSDEDIVELLIHTTFQGMTGRS
ncbi:TetR/AcrR family transcriptional regulator [Zwartia sp.]|uniref:TetR/AcrR family transcriptional regulator n=1 Tax=Zwartia sp. TaxID=2978004 RepID=UPI003BB17A00